MKKVLFGAVLLSMMFPRTGFSALHSDLKDLTHRLPNIPVTFTSSSETTTLEWGCPVSEVVSAESPAEALQKITNECIEEVKRAANQKPDVFDVIQTSVVWPDVNVSKTNAGYLLNGTFFLETLVLRRLAQDE